MLRSDCGTGFVWVMGLVALGAFCLGIGSRNAAYATEMSVLKMCGTTAAVSSERFQAVLSEASMASPQERKILLEIMGDKNNGCRKELERRLLEIREKPSNFRSNTGRHAALNLGFMLDMPAALEIVEAEAASTGAPEWLAMLSQWDERAYSTLLRGRLLGSAEKIRNQIGLSKAPSALYGKSSIEERTQPVEKTAITPLLLDLFLKTALASSAVSAEEFAALNIHYAVGTAALRQIFGERYVALLKKNTVLWIAVFREEQPWAQFQMVELMGKVGGSEMIRELLWLSQNHTDDRMKSRASQALDSALQLR